MADIKTDGSKCVGCGICILTCPEPNIIELDKNKKAKVNAMRCKRCLLCVAACPKKALHAAQE